MSSKTGEYSSAQTGSDALYCKWGPVSYNNRIQEYDIKPVWNLVLSSKTDTAFPLKEGKITLFSDFFKFCNFRLPITKFWLVKLRHFEFACIALGHIPEITVFRAFFVLLWKSSFFTFDRRDIGVSCLRDIPTSSRDKGWKKKFFYIDVGVIPGEMQWREMGAKDKFKDDGPPGDAYVENALFKSLCQRPSECTVIPEGALVMAGMSLIWRDISGVCLVSWTPPRNAALRAADRVIEEQEPDVLKVHLEQFLLPTVTADPTAYISQPPPAEEAMFLLQRQRDPPG
ncbi:hypothetical protein Hanom_Chr00s000005g01610931 [Helianthus anomalus]